MKLPDSGTPLHCADYILANQEAGQPQAPWGKNVAASINRVTRQLRAQLTEQQRYRLKHQADIAENYHHSIPRAAKSRHYFTNNEAREWPIYAGLLHDQIVTGFYEGVNSESPPRDLADLARRLLILHLCGAKRFRNGQLYRFTAFTRKITHAASEQVTPLAKICSDLVTSTDIDRARAKLEKLARSPDTKEKKLSSLVDDLIFILIALTGDGLVEDPTTDNEQEEEKNKHPLLTEIDRDRETQDDEHWYYPADEESFGVLGSTSETDTEGTTLSLGLHGHRLRLNRLFSGDSDEQLLEPEARLAMNWLISQHFEDQIYQAACFCWIITGLFGRRYDDIIGHLSGHADRTGDGNIRNITSENNNISLELIHPIASRIAKFNPDEPDPSVLFTLKANLPPNINVKQSLDTLRECEDGDICQKVLDAKLKIKSLLRSLIDRFTETRFRGALVQQTFSQNYDLPITQLIFDERLERSTAALHYIVIDEHLLNQYLERARSTLYGHDYSPDIPSTHIVGAPKAMIGLKALADSAAWFNKQWEEINKRGRPKDQFERHNQIARTTQHLMHIGTAHRGTYNLAEITI